MPSLTEDLKNEIALASRCLEEHPQARAVLYGTAPAEQLARYYATAHATVREAVGLLREARDQLRTEGAEPALVSLVSAKVDEEHGHEDWLADDLEAIGYPLGGSKTPAPGPAAAAYLTFHRHIIPLCGASFLGTALVLEALSLNCAGRAAQNLRDRSSIEAIRAPEPRGIMFFTTHHDADVGHVAALSAAIERFVIAPKAQHYLLLSARFTATLYADFFS